MFIFNVNSLIMVCSMDKDPTHYLGTPVPSLTIEQGNPHLPEEVWPFYMVTSPLH